MDLRVGAYVSYSWEEQEHPYHTGVLAHSIAFSPIRRVYFGVRWTNFGVWGDRIRSERYFGWEPYGQYYMGLNKKLQFFAGIGFRFSNFAQMPNRIPFRREGQKELSLSGGADIQLWKQLRLEIGFVTNPIFKKELGQYWNNYPYIGLEWSMDGKD